MEKFKVIIVEDVPLELKGTEGILRNDIPEAEIIVRLPASRPIGASSRTSNPTSSSSTSDWADPQPSAWRSAGRPSSSFPP